MLSHQELLLRLITAAVLGGLVGLERERMEWAAGLRTHMLVCIGSALLMIVSAYGFADVLGKPNVVLDPSRIAAQVVSGVGFLGAGTILFLRQRVIRGLTTAASLWAVAAVGLAIGGGMFFAATVSTVLVVSTLAVLKPIERRLFRRHPARVITVVIDREHVSLPELQNTLRHAKLTISRVTLKRVPKSASDDSLEFELDRSGTPENVMSAMAALQGMNGVRQVSY
ncbi:MAG TPA: MgtC/SapB family protein [Candidatus Aquabacterium excrementipullorum]|nr:MgtC/SapB family protein [Candidatus Aquabacterium excrementipullorum]